MRLFFSFIVIFFCSCSSYFSKVNFEYRGKMILKKNLAIVNLSDIMINYQGNVENEFGKGRTKDLIEKFIYSQIKLALNDSSTFDYVWFDSLENIKALSMKEYYNGNKLVAFPISENSDPIKLKKRDAKFILFLNALDFGSKFTAHNIGGPIPAIIPTKDLACSVEYLIWDNENNLEVAWGRVCGNTSQFACTTRRGFEEVVSDMVGKILKRTAFSVKGI